MSFIEGFAEEFEKIAKSFYTNPKGYKGISELSDDLSRWLGSSAKKLPKGRLSDKHKRILRYGLTGAGAGAGGYELGRRAIRNAPSNDLPCPGSGIRSKGQGRGMGTGGGRGPIGIPVRRKRI